MPGWIFIIPGLMILEDHFPRIKTRTHYDLIGPPARDVLIVASRMTTSKPGHSAS